MRDPPTPLPRIDVIGAPYDEGTIDSGYRAKTTSTTGPWGALRLQDAPYSITVIPEALIENVTTRSVDQLFKMAPLVQSGQSQDVNGIAQATIRGFNVARVYVNGVQNNNLGLGVFVEEIERLEILNGLSGFLYGASPVGGVINYQLKQPPPTDLRRLTIGDYGGQQYFVHADLGGPIDPDNHFGYRLNVLYQNGDTAIDNQRLRRALVSGSLDWRPADNVLIQLNLAKKEFRLDGRPFQFFLGGNVPEPLDGTKLYAPKGTFVDVRTEEANLEMVYALQPNITIRAAYQHKKDDRSLVYGIGDLHNDETEYDLYLFGGRFDALSDGGYAYVDWSFPTGGIRHDLTVGVNGYQYRNRLASLSGGTPFLSEPPVTVALSNPEVNGVSVPNWDLAVSHWVVNARSSNLNTLAGDHVTIDDRWSALLGVNHSVIQSKSFDPISGDGIDGSRYRRSAVTPSASVLYRPAGYMSAYATYIESLEQGAIVDSTYRNAGAILPPLRSRQYELGVKAELEPLQLGAALFRIDKPNERSDDGTPFGTFVQNGREAHTGLELSAIGRPIHELAVMAGLTLMDNEVNQTGDPSTDGKRPTGVAGRTLKLYAEYTPDALHGWTLTTGAYLNGYAYQDVLNTRRFPGYALFDVGGRYRTRLFGKHVEARVNVSNLADRRYWAATSPGAPRMVAFSVSADL